MVALSTLDERFDTFVPTFDKVVGSFQLTPASGATTRQAKEIE
jgi:hypothetical protein